MKLARIRQPTVLHLEWPPEVDTATVGEFVEIIDDALQNVGGTLVIGHAKQPRPSSLGAADASEGTASKDVLPHRT